MLLTLSWLLTAVTMATAAISSSRLSCSCTRPDVNYRQTSIRCGAAKGTSDTNILSRNIACKQETEGRLPPGYQYTPRIPALYRFYRNFMTYQLAEEFCKRDGGRLAVPRDKSQADVLAGILEAVGGIQEAFVGVNDIAAKGTFVTVTGERASYVPFEEGKEQNIGSCLFIDRGGYFNRRECDWTTSFFCQRDLNPAPPDGYSYLPGLGFYKDYNDPLAYEEAKKRCQQDGAHLAVLDTQEEAEELLKAFHNTRLQESLIGLTDLAEEGHFVTDTGKPEESLSFLNWFPGEPNNRGDQEDCVTINRAKSRGALNDVSCQIPYSFLCELALPS